MLRIAALSLCVALAILAGCASTPEASPGNDADAKRFEPAPNAAIIYIYRPTGSGNGISTIWLDGRLVGETLSRTYFRVAVRPGRNRITASGGDAGRLEIDTKADGVYYVETRVAGETQSESNTFFRSVAPATGRTAILECCSMLDTWRPGQSRINNF
jgi:hypothetical protein